MLNLNIDLIYESYVFSVTFTAVATIALLFLLFFIAVRVLMFLDSRKKTVTESENFIASLPKRTVKNESANTRITLDDRIAAVPEVYTDKIQIGISSKKGTRKYQQDSVVAMDRKTMSDLQFKKSIAILCDGMGGMEGGELASAVTAKTLYEDYCKANPSNIPSFFRNEVRKLDDIVSNLRDNNNRIMDSGSTLVCAVVENGMFNWLSVGDSRIYILRKNEMVQITTDHNYYYVLKNKVKEGVISAAEAENDPRKEALISYIGIGKESEIGLNEKPFQLVDGDIILLCSDGLYKTLSDGEIAEIIFRYCGDVEKAAEELTETAVTKKRKGQDNTSVALIRYNNW